MTLTLKVGFVGWRGVVGSVLLARLVEEQELNRAQWRFFSTSNAGGRGPVGLGGGLGEHPLLDAHSIRDLSQMDVLVVCQGGDYTKSVYSALRKSGWEGYWLDASSALRLESFSRITLEPVNGHLIQKSLEDGVKTFVGGNCTVSLQLMAIGALFAQDLVQWVNASTYQAASGAGAAAMDELLEQIKAVGSLAVPKPLQEQAHAQDQGKASSHATLHLEHRISQHLRNNESLSPVLKAPLVCNVLPYIDSPMDSGQTREEWKATVEAQRIMDLEVPVPIDGTCVRVGSLRCHAQALSIKLKRDVPLDEIRAMLCNQHEWLRFVPNEKSATLEGLTPVAISGTRTIAVGRLRKLAIDENVIGLFTVGDQLLWGAAEPLRCMLNRLYTFLK